MSHISNTHTNTYTFYINFFGSLLSAVELVTRIDLKGNEKKGNLAQQRKWTKTFFSFMFHFIRNSIIAISFPRGVELLCSTCSLLFVSIFSSGYLYSYIVSHVMYLESSVYMFVLQMDQKAVRMKDV